eukprot:gnl/TRDRNA2_/TRDRNA2_82129_c0_seq1.p1 gnl/TRDRNA2_/TRDRNA2_82129_c0~~gnl/TRDRNA2_/TRDRNA2_82129_c0_seq1.p1  ORF type:complete len:328 (+),score=26.64 gnl/TRDRNA2_/TRDRNA2_82129_c0_seq1:67-984(+)
MRDQTPVLVEPLLYHEDACRACTTNKLFALFCLLTSVVLATLTSLFLCTDVDAETVDAFAIGRPSHLAHRMKVQLLGPSTHSGSVSPAARRVTAYAVFHHDLARTAVHFNPQELKLALHLLHDLPQQWITWYDHKALEFPLTTKASTAGVCYSLGDMCAQGISGKNLSTLDLARSARSGAVGLACIGPMAHYWLTFLDESLNFGGAWWAVFPKMALEEGPMTMLYNTIYSVLTGALAFRDPKDILTDFKATFLPGYLESIRFGPAVNFITFTVIPVELQVLWMGATEIVWICILSRVNNEDIHPE